MNITEAMVKDAAEFSSFAQRVKMAYWTSKEYQNKYKIASESMLDDILMCAYDDIKQHYAG